MTKDRPFANLLRNYALSHVVGPICWTDLYTNIIRLNVSDSTRNGRILFPALQAGLLDWGHHAEAVGYLRYFFGTKVNATDGAIIYSLFGCDSDADYGRLIHTYVKAVQYSGNLTFAAEVLPIIHAMANRILLLRSAAERAFPAGNPLHGIVPGSPEHDICGDPGYFFSINVWYVRSLIELHQLHAEYPSLSRNVSLEGRLLPTAEIWRRDVHAAADFTAVRRSDGAGLFFLHPVVGSVFGLRKAGSPPLLPGGDESDCVDRGTCFASMSASLPDGGSNQHTNYANFRIFSETLLAGVLDPEFELAIMTFRESHRGTVLGMTRFRDGLDDMPILGYNRGNLHHDRIGAFHSTLVGHSLNYLTRGTFWGTEQRGQRQPVSGARYRNDCGHGGEDCSLCMVSSISSAIWIRWMFVSEHADDPVVFVARGIPRRWLGQGEDPVSITGAPTRFGRLNFTMRATAGATAGALALRGVIHGDVAITVRATAAIPAVAVRLPSVGSTPFTCITVVGPATLVAWHPNNETAVVMFNPGGSKLSPFRFSFSTSFSASC